MCDACTMWSRTAKTQGAAGGTTPSGESLLARQTRLHFPNTKSEIISDPSGRKLSALSLATQTRPRPECWSKTRHRFGRGNMGCAACFIFVMPWSFCLVHFAPRSWCWCFDCSAIAANAEQEDESRQREDSNSMWRLTCLDVLRYSSTLFSFVNTTGGF